MWGRYFGADSSRCDAFLQENGLLDIMVGMLGHIKNILSHTDTLASKYGVLYPPGSFYSAYRCSSASTIENGKAKSKFIWAMSDKAKFTNHITDLRTSTIAYASCCE
jgi:hypothetical protein